MCQLCTLMQRRSRPAERLTTLNQLSQVVESRSSMSQPKARQSKSGSQLRSDLISGVNHSTDIS
jgi:F0F1-type ATP synthase assembly protein I